MSEQDSTKKTPRRVRVNAKKVKKDVITVFPEESNDILGIVNTIKDVRSERQITQKEICEKTGLSASTVSKIESEAAGLNVRCIARILRSMNMRLHITCKPLDSPESNPDVDVESN